MILLDPDLNSGPRLKRGAARRYAGRETPRKNLQLPSARVLAGFLARAQASMRLRGEVSVLLTTDGTIRRLNRQFRGKDKATDVLSFPATGFVQSQKKNQKKNQEKGDLAISVETARRQSLACGHSLETEIQILMLHGLLHLNGFDHVKDAGEMARRERALRARLGLERGLIERAHDFSQGRSADPPRGGPSASARPLLGLAQDDSQRGLRSKSASQQVSKSAVSHPGRGNKNAASTRNGKARGAR